MSEYRHVLGWDEDRESPSLVYEHLGAGYEQDSFDYEPFAFCPECGVDLRAAHGRVIERAIERHFWPGVYDDIARYVDPERVEEARARARALARRMGFPQYVTDRRKLSDIIQGSEMRWLRASVRGLQAPWRRKEINRARARAARPRASR